MTPDIRPFQDADLGPVVDLWHLCGLTRPWNPPEGDIAFVRTSGHGELLVAVAEEGLVGTIMVGHDGHRGWIYYVAVTPDRQRSGLGARLVAAGEAWLKTRGVRKAELMIRRTNDAVAAFYDRLGYEREPVIVMSRWLDGTRR